MSDFDSNPFADPEASPFAVKLGKMKLLLSKGDVEGSLKLFERCIEQSSLNQANQARVTEFPMKFGKLLMNENKHFEAVSVLNRGLRIVELLVDQATDNIRPELVKVHWEMHDNLAVCHAKLNQDESEAEHYSKAIEILSKESYQPQRYASMMNNLGNCYKSLMQYDKAREMLEQCKKLKMEDGQAGENGILPEAYQKTISILANVYKAMDLRDRAITEYEYLIQGIQAGDISARQARRLQDARSKLAELYVLQGKIEKAKEVSRESCGNPLDFLTDDPSNSTDDRKRQKAALAYSKNYQIGLSAQSGKNHQTAVDAYEQALVDIEAAGDAINELSDKRSALSLVHNNLGNSYQSMRLYKSAEQHLSEALRIRQETYGVNGVSDLYGSSHCNLGNLYSLIGQKERALKHYKEAVRIYTALGTDRPRFARLLARSYKSMGQAYQAIDKDGGKRAVEVYEKARSLYEEFQSDNLEGLQVVTNNLGNAYRSVGAYESSEESLRTSLSLAESMLERKPEDVSLLNDKAASLNNLGLTLKSMAKLDSAIDYLKQCCELRLELIRKFNSTKAKVDFAGSIQNLGGCYIDAKNYGIAIEYFKRAAEAFRNLEMSDKTCRLAMSVCYENMGDEENALAVLGD